MGTTSLKLTPALRRRVASLAKSEGVSPHAFMVVAIERQAAEAEARRSFIEEADAADEDMTRTGLGYRHDEVKTWFAERLKGRPAKAPKARKWR